MKIVGIVAADWANASWNIFQALERYGLDARLINMFPRKCQIKNHVKNYDIKFWEIKGENLAHKLIGEADIYHICESGGTVKYLNQFKLKDRPKLLSINSSEYYLDGAQEKFNKVLKPHGDRFVGLTLNYPISEIEFGPQPVDEMKFEVRSDYSLKNEKRKLVIGCAPGHMESFRNDKTKGLRIVQSKTINSLDIIIDKSQSETYSMMLNNHDVFTHGIAPAYGYTLIEAAVMGIPCFGHIKSRDKHLVSINGKYPVPDIGSAGEKLKEVLEPLNEENEREKLGRLMREWALKYHSYEACYKIYKEFYEEMV